MPEETPMEIQTKFVGLSRRYWGLALTLYAGVIPFAGQLLGVDLTETLPLLSGAGDAFFAMVGALLLAWSKFRPDGRGNADFNGTGPLSNLAILLALVPFIGGCVSFDSAGAIRQADRFQARATVEQDECDGFRKAAAALKDEGGAAVAMKYIGSAGDVAQVAHALALHAIQCDEVVSRGGTNADLVAKAAASFSKTWHNARTVAQ